MSRRMLSALLMAIASGCTQQPNASRELRLGAASSQPSASAAASAQPVGTIQDLMTEIIDPAATYIWRSVSSVSTVDQVVEYVPRTGKEWNDVARQAVVLAEAANLLTVPGRRAAQQSITLSYQTPLDIVAIDTRLQTNPSVLYALAGQLREVSIQIRDAAQRHDPDAIVEIGGTLKEVCEGCHKVYWYPEALGALAADAGQAK